MSIETSSKTTPIKKNHNIHIFHGSPDSNCLTSNHKQKYPKVNENPINVFSTDEKKSSARKNPDDLKPVSVLVDHD